MSKTKTRLQKFQEYVEKCHELRNLTPHDVVILVGDNTTLRYEPFGTTVRIPTTFTNISQYMDIEITRKAFKKEGVVLPEFEDGVLNIVSTIVAQYVAENQPERVDFVTIGKVIRDSSGHIEGIKNFGFIE